jgi:DNA-binding PadR family transcriptional regulator
METLRLPATSYVILAILTFREMSGYELKFVIDKSIGYFYVSPAYSQIYAELRRLESHGLVTMQKVTQKVLPDKRLYSLTPQGRAVIQQWLAEAKVEPDTYKSPFQLRLFFGHLLPPERLLACVGNQRRWLTESVLTLEEREQDLRRRMQGPTPEKTLLFPLLVVELNLATFRAELAWADSVIERLAQWSTEEALDQSGAHENPGSRPE